MRALLLNGNQIVTADAIADAVVTYHLALHRAHRVDVVDLPVIVDGELGACRLPLVPTQPVAWISAPHHSPTIEGAQTVAAQILARARALDAEMWL